MNHRTAPRLRRALRWILMLAAVAIVALAALILAPGWLYDTDALPPGHGQVRTELFAPAGAPRPLLVGFGGGEGGNAWASDHWRGQRERFLDQGYAMLAVGYFGMPGTPEYLDRISLDAIHAAITDAGADPRVDGRCVVLIGGSKGAELALALAAHFPDIDGVVALVPGEAVFAGLTPALATSSFSLRGTPLPFVPVPWSAVPGMIAPEHRGAFEAMLADDAAVERASIPVERINGPILLLSATRDEMWPSTPMSERMVARLHRNGFRFPYRHVAIEGGHAAPLKHFRQIEQFLGDPATAPCRTPAEPGADADALQRPEPAGTEPRAATSGQPAMS